MAELVKEKKLCILKEGLGLGGTERSSANISFALENDYETRFCLFDARSTSYQFGGSLIDMNAPSRPSIVGKVLNTALRYLKLKRMLRREKPDVIYEFFTIENPLSHVRHKRSVRIISCRDFGKAKRLNSSFKHALDRADGMICNSEYIRSYYLKNHPEDVEKVFAVHNIIDVPAIKGQSAEDVDARFTAFVKEHEFTAVSVGRFCREKGYECLIEALKVAREGGKKVGLVLVGDGEYRARYEEKIRSLNLEAHVYFTGFDKNPYKYVSRCDVFVLSSLSEGFPNVLAEAMALSLPVISTNCYSGPAEILREDGNYEAVTQGVEECDYGIMVPRIDEENPSRSAEELGRAMEVLAGSEELRKKYSALSSKRAEEYTEERARVRLGEIFESLLEKKKDKRNR